MPQSAPEKPLVSVVVPVYNGEKFLLKTADSILGQTFRDFELLLIDDGSSDSCPDLIQTLESRDDRVRGFRKSNGGVADARNFGIESSRGALIAFCDQDDIWHEAKLRKQIPLFNDADVGLVYCGAENSRATGITLNQQGVKEKPSGSIFAALIERNCITCCTAVARRQLLLDLKAFDTSRDLMGIDDWHMWLRLSRVCKVAYVAENLATHVFHDSNYSGNEEAMLNAELVCLEKIKAELGDESYGYDWRRLRAEINFRYAGSLVNVGEFRRAARAFRESRYVSGSRGHVLSLIMQYSPEILLRGLQNAKRRLTAND